MSASLVVPVSVAPLLSGPRQLLPFRPVTPTSVPPLPPDESYLTLSNVPGPV